MSEPSTVLPRFTSSAGDFLSEDNLCGQNLLRIVARGSSIIAELLRLADNIPEIFLGADQVQDPDQQKYLQVMFDFQYLKEPEHFEKSVNDNRFYKLFESIWKYQADFAKYIEDVRNGFYIQHSLDDILQELDGKQLLSEALYLYGVMLLLLEEKMPGPATLENFEDVCKLCRNTGYIPGEKGKKPKNHPVAYFNRFAPDAEAVSLITACLQTDDIYLMSNSFPKPEHRTTRLAGQASMLFVILMFSGSTLSNDKNAMRMTVDKFFNDNWVIPTYMGFWVDLTFEWQHMPAAKAALDNVISASNVKTLALKNKDDLNSALNELKLYLNEGVLVPDFVLDHMNNLLDCVRNCNVALRWRVLQRKSKNGEFKKIVFDTAEAKTIVTLLLNMSQLEFILKDMLAQLLEEKDVAWTDGKAQAADRMNMMKWFSGLGQTVTDLTFDGEHATATGRKIQGLINALEDVEQFEAIDTNVQIKTFLHEARDIFRQMIRTVNIKNEIMNILENISDLSYAWGTLPDYLPVFHDRVHREPSTVVLLRATFLKTASILDVPLVRITSIASPDAESVAEYYSSELVEFVRRVLEIIPKSVFQILSEIEQIQTHKMVPIPTLSIFTEGVLVMQKTLLGVIQVDPRMILQEGLRRELVRLIAKAMFENLNFAILTQREIYARIARLAATLDGLKRSIEYLQDYIDIAGLQMYQQELSRKIFDRESRYQSREVPIPRLTSMGDSNSYVNFMGQTMKAILFLTDSSRCGVRTFALLQRSLGVIGLRGLDRLFAFRTQLFPEHLTVASASRTYTSVMKKVEKLMLPLLQHIRRIAKLDANLLSQALDTFNRGVLNDIRKHYHNPDDFPYPGPENPLLFETSVLSEACGMNDPCNKIYITSQPLEGLPVLLFLFLMAYLPKLEYDINFATLVRKKAAYPLDGTPLAVGLACLLRQFHPAVTRKLICYLGQFVRTTIQSVFSDVDTKAVDIPEQAVHTLLFLEQLCHYASVPRSVVHAYVPPYIFDSLQLPSASAKK
eukprot:GSChrysophyteH1.ASY1.ANO1.449.1 assembled CDS